MALTFQYKESSLSKDLVEMQKKLGAAVLMYASTKAKELEGFMKTERRWRDRTGQAKATLLGTVSQPNETTVRITLSHGVNYGIWLELAHEKNYAIIRPTILLHSHVVIEGFQNMMSLIAW